MLSYGDLELFAAADQGAVDTLLAIHPVGPKLAEMVKAKGGEVLEFDGGSPQAAELAKFTGKVALLRFPVADLPGSGAADGGDIGHHRGTADTEHRRSSDTLINKTEITGHSCGDLRPGFAPTIDIDAIVRENNAMLGPTLPAGAPDELGIELSNELDAMSAIFPVKCGGAEFRYLGGRSRTSLLWASAAGSGDGGPEAVLRVVLPRAYPAVRADVVLEAGFNLSNPDGILAGAVDVCKATAGSPVLFELMSYLTDALASSDRRREHLQHICTSRKSPPTAAA